MLIAEDLLLLLLDDESGAPQSSYLRPGLGGAVLVEFALSEHVTIEKRSRWRTATVAVAAQVPAPQDPLLADALTTIAEKPRSAQDLVDRLDKDLHDTLCERLVQRGILERRESRVLGIFPRHRWPARDVTHEEQVRRSIAAVLVDAQEPDTRTAALIALLSALDRAHKTIDRGEASAREIRRRATAIADGNWAAQGVRDAIQAATAAMTAVIATSAAAAASTS